MARSRRGWRATALAVCVAMLTAGAVWLAPPAGAVFSSSSLPEIPLGASTAPTGAGPWGLDIAPDGTAYVTNTNRNTVSVVPDITNPAATQLVEIPVGSFPYDVAVAPNGMVYVVNVSSNNVSVISTATNTVVATIPVGVEPSGVAADPNPAADPARARVYVTNAGSASISVIDTTTNTVTSTIAPVSGDPEGIAVAPDGIAYVAHAGSNTVSVIEGGAVAATIPVPGAPIGITVAPDGFVFTAGFGNGRINKIDPVSRTVAATFPAGSLGTLYDIDVATDGAIYVSAFNSTTVPVFNPNGTQRGTMQVGKAFPRDVRLSPDESVLVVPSQNWGTLHRLVPSYTPDPPPTVPTVATNPASTNASECGIALFTASGSASSIETIRWEIRTGPAAPWQPLAAPDWRGHSAPLPASGTVSTTAFVRADLGREGSQLRAVFENASGSVATDPATLGIASMTTVTPDPAPDGSIPTDRRPIGIDAAPDGTMYVTEYEDGSVARIVGSAVADRVPDVGERVAHVVVDPTDPDVVYAIRETQCPDNVVRMEDGAVTDRWRFEDAGLDPHGTPLPAMPMGIDVGADGLVRVVGPYAESLRVLDPTTGVWSAETPLPTLPSGVAVGADGTAFATSYFGDGPDPDTDADGTLTIVPPGGGPTAVLAVGLGARSPVIDPTDPTGQTVWVVAEEDDAVVPVVDGVVGTPVAVGERPTAIDIDPVTGLLYVTSFWDDEVWIVDLDESPPAVLAGIPVGAGPTDITVRPSDGRAYVTSSFAQSVSPVLAATTTVVGSSPAPSTYGQAVTFTVTVVAPPDAGSPTGSVSFTGVPGCSTATLDAAGEATCTTALLDVGSNPVGATYAGDRWFGLSAGQADHVVDPAPLTITAPSPTRPTGAANPPLLPTYDGLVGGDTEPTTPPTCSTTATPSSPVGTYAVTCTGAADPSYTITHVDGTLTVVERLLLVVAPSPTTTYGDPLPVTEPGYQGLAPGDLAPATPAICTTVATPSSEAGAYAVTCSGASDPRYAITYAEGTHTIIPAPLVVTAPSPTIAAGSASPALDPTYGGLVAGDTAPATAATCSTTATSSSPAGTYPVTCSGAADPSYSITYVDGTLTITGGSSGPGPQPPRPPRPPEEPEPPEPERCGRPAGPGRFIDDDANAHECAIDAIAAAGLTVGCDPSGDRYCPAHVVTRGQLASLLDRHLDVPATDQDFYEDDDGSVHEAAINRLTAAGIVVGLDDGRFHPDQPVSRAQVASYLARALGLDLDGTPPFDDVDGGPHAGAIAALEDAGITLGCDPEGRRYCPRDPTRRDQMASLLARAFGLLPTEQPGASSTRAARR